MRLALAFLTAVVFFTAITARVVNNDDEEGELANQLLVEESIGYDNSVVAVSMAKLEELSLFHGDTVLLKGKNHRSTLGIVIFDEECPDGNIRMNRVVCNNLRVQSGDAVSITPRPNVEEAKHVTIVPFEDSVQGFTGDLYEEYLKPYFANAFRPLHQGDTFIVSRGMRAVEFKVTKIDPEPFGFITAETTIHMDGEPIDRDDEDV